MTKLISITLLCFATQAQTAKPTFEVASVKPATPLGPRGMQANHNVDPVRYSCQNCPVFWVLSEAYDLKLYEYNGPDWVHQVRFDFDAKIPEGTRKEALHQMLQNLLGDRFKLAVHREEREMQVYELSVMKGGPRFQQSIPSDSGDTAPPSGRLNRDADGFPILTKGTQMSLGLGKGRLRSDDQPMSWLVEILSNQMQGPVKDATGLSAKYDYQLSWAWDENSGSGMMDEFRSALIRALQSQLGLKLEQKKGKVEVLVVDHIDKAPTEN